MAKKREKTEFQKFESQMAKLDHKLKVAEEERLRKKRKEK